MHVVGWRGDLRVHVDLPVGLARDVDPAEVAAVILGVGPSQEQLATGLSGGVSEKKNPKPVNISGRVRTTPSACPQNTQRGAWG